jgi:hypothetical protein
MMRGELPLRVIRSPGGGLAIRCLCGAESAVVRPASELSAPVIRAGRGTSLPTRGVAGDVSPAGVLRMAAHAQACQRGLDAGREVA